MNMNSIVPNSPNYMFVPRSCDANTKSSIIKFTRWLDSNSLLWFNVDLRDYLDYLNSQDLARSSVKKHMERIRVRYRDMLNSNELRDTIQSQIDRNASPADIYAITQEILTRLSNNTQYSKRLEVKLTKVASYVDSDFTWLSRRDIQEVFDRIPKSKLGYRDAAIFGLCLSYGLREFEACAVTVENLTERQSGKHGILVEHGKKDKRRFVLFDECVDYTDPIELWTQIADIQSGLILKGLKTRQLQNRVALYTTATPHDLRRSYAKLAYESGRSVEFIKQQLGHEKIETTLLYLGILDG